MMKSHQYVKKPAEVCSFLRSYRVAACSFTKTKTPSEVFFTVSIRLVAPYGETRYSYKTDSGCYLPSIDKYDLRRHYILSINGVYSCNPGQNIWDKL